MIENNLHACLLLSNLFTFYFKFNQLNLSVKYSWFLFEWNIMCDYLYPVQHQAKIPAWMLILNVSTKEKFLLPIFRCVKYFFELLLLMVVSWRRQRRFYGAPAACNCFPTEFYLAIDCTLAEYPPSAYGVLRVFASRSVRWRRAQDVLYLLVCKF